MSFVLNSGLKIFDVIEILWKSPVSREDFCEKMYERGIIIEPETVSKYIRTLRSLGFEIKSKKGNVYEILKTPFQIKLNEKEKEGFFAFMKGAKSLASKKNPENSFLQYKITGLAANVPDNDKFDENLKYGDNEEFLDILYDLNRYIYTPSKVRALIRKVRTVIVPKRIRYGKNGAFLTAYEIKSQKIKIFNVKEIKELKYVSPLKENEMLHSCGTIFVLKGRLMRNYILREGEVAHYKGDEVRVTNFYEEKEELFKRLMKYGDKCEIVQSKEDVEKFKLMLRKTMEHYKSM